MKRRTYLIPFFFVAATLLVTEPALAQANPVEGWLQNIVDFFTNGITRLIAILAIIIAGFLAFSGRTEWSTFGRIVFGILIITVPIEIYNMLQNWTS